MLIHKNDPEQHNMGVPYVHTVTPSMFLPWLALFP